MDFATVGNYRGRSKAAVWVDKGVIRAVMGEQKDRVRVEAMEDFIVLTDPQEQQFRYRDR